MRRRERWVVTTLITLIIPLLSVAAPYSNGEENITNAFDENGRRTGYWIIDGSIKATPGYDANQVIEEGHYESNRKEGLWKRYFPNGNMQSEITYKRNMPSGAYKTYHKNGNLEEEGNWVNNRNTGSFVRYYPSGMVAQEFEFTDGGLRDGVQKYYYENGQAELVVNIKEGKEHGKMTRYYSNGDIKEELKFDGGVAKESTRKTYKEIQPQENIKETQVVPVIESKPVVETEDKPNISVFKSTGKNTLYNKNKLISQTGYFKNGRLWNGKKYKYDSNGILKAIEIYKSGKFLGNGVLEEESK